MMKTSIKQMWTLGAVMVVGGCQLGVEQLEVGDSQDDTDESGEAPTDGESDTNDQNADACVTQGTNLGGGSEPLDFQLPACEVECATGWGHGAPPLANAWTLDLEHHGSNTGFTHLGLLPSGDVVAITSQSDAPARLILISPDGELLDDIAQPDITGDVQDMGVDQGGTIYALWHTDEGMLSAMTSDGELAWTVGLGHYQRGVLTPLALGVMMALNPADELDTSYLVHVHEAGGIMQVGPIPPTWEIAVAPSGNTVATANSTTITWTDFSPFPTATRTQGVADVDFVFGLVALDDERVASVGVAKNWDEDGLTHGYLNQIGPMGLAWSGRYDRALSWCPDGIATDEKFLDVVRLADDSLLVVGSEGAGDLDAGQPGDEQLQQPWVGHVSAQGDVLATDRGFWRGQAVAAAGAEDGSAYVLLNEFDEDNQQRLYVRKYLP